MGVVNWTLLMHCDAGPCISTRHDTCYYVHQSSALFFFFKYMQLLFFKFWVEYGTKCIRLDVYMYSCVSLLEFIPSVRRGQQGDDRIHLNYRSVC